MVVKEREPSSKKYSLLPSWGFVPAAHDIALKRLTSAIIGQAAADARKDDTTGQEAQRWLLSRDCADLCEFIGLDFNTVHAWVTCGCPDWRKKEDGT